MKMNKLLTIAVVLLLLVNVTMLVFMLKAKKHHGPPRKDGKGDVFGMMVKDLDMTEQQQVDFKKLKADHFKNIGPVFDSIKTLKKSLFGLVKAETVNDSVVSRYSGLIAEQQAIVDKATVNHFRTVRALFTGDQQKKFDEFIQKMMQRRGRGGDSTGKNKPL